MGILRAPASSRHGQHPAVQAAQGPRPPPGPQLLTRAFCPAPEEPGGQPVLPSKPPNGLSRPWQKFLSSSIAWKNVQRQHSTLQSL